MTRWDAARAANNRPLKKPIKFHDPVGDPALSIGEDRHCSRCKYMICSCDFVPPPYGKTDSGIPIAYTPYIKHGGAIFSAFEGIRCGLLLRSDLEAIKKFIGPVKP